METAATKLAYVTWVTIHIGESLFFTNIGGICVCRCACKIHPECTQCGCTTRFLCCSKTHSTASISPERSTDLPHAPHVGLSLRPIESAEKPPLQKPLGQQNNLQVLNINKSAEQSGSGEEGLGAEGLKCLQGEAKERLVSVCVQVQGEVQGAQ